jgi:hypothetical protein
MSHGIPQKPSVHGGSIIGEVGIKQLKILESPESP